MIARRTLVAVGGGLAVALLLWILFVALPGRYGRAADAPAETPPQSTSAAERRITATLYFISEDGLSLVGSQREVPFGEPVAEQARLIVEAQLGEAPPPRAAAIPEGTALRSLFLTERGDAFVDLTGEVRAKHSGGALDELFTVYAVVNALTVNLPAIQRVQILIDGQEVDTLAGHVDLRHPLKKSLSWAERQ